MNPTDDQLKAALVRALPEKLYWPPNRTCPYWISGDAVTPHEWPAIVAMVEEGLTEDQKWDERGTVFNICYKQHGGKCPYPTMFASWQTRALALADIGAIKLEETK